jgi:hypothetical protein
VKYTRTLLAALALSATMISLAGCGSSSVTQNTLAPTLDTTPPAAPTNVHGDFDPHYVRDYVSWDLSASSDVASYEIWQYSSDPAVGGTGVLIGHVVSSVNSLVLPEAKASGTTYIRVRAIDTSSNTSAFSSTAPVATHGEIDGSGGGGLKDPGVF